MKQGYFKFKGVDSRTYKCYLENMPPLTRAPRVYKETTVPGGDGSYIEEYGYSAYDMTLNIAVTDTSKLENLVSLLNGSGNLILGNDTTKYYKANFLDGINYEKLMRFRKASVKVRVQPFRYPVTDSEKTFTAKATVNNQGTYKSMPVITINGTGTFNVIINDTTVCTLENVEGTIVVDSQTKECYNGTTNLNRKKTGDFPEFNPGANTINITGGTLTNYKVKGYNRWL